MQKNENSTEIARLIEKSKNTSAGLGGYIVYMVILLALLLIDVIYYGTHRWYDVDYDIYTGLFRSCILFYTTVYLFKGTEGHRIIYGWRRWTLGCVFAVWTLLYVLGTWASLEQTGERIHSNTGYTRTELRELIQSYLDEGYTMKDVQAHVITETFDKELYDRIFGFLYIASCCGLWYWTVSVKAIEEQENEEDEDNAEE